MVSASPDFVNLLSSSPNYAADEVIRDGHLVSDLTSREGSRLTRGHVTGVLQVRHTYIGTRQQAVIKIYPPKKKLK